MQIATETSARMKVFVLDTPYYTTTHRKKACVSIREVNATPPQSWKQMAN